MRVCSKCHKEKPEDSFHNGGTWYCKPCQRAYAKHRSAVSRQMKRASALKDAEDCPTCETGKVDPRQPSYSHCLDCYRDAQPYKNRRGLKGTGVSHVTFYRMLQEQKFLCLICGVHDSERKLVADHCHASSTFRGAICASCNSGLGMFYDNPGAIRRAANYLQGRVVSPPKGTYYRHQDSS